MKKKIIYISLFIFVIPIIFLLIIWKPTEKFIKLDNGNIILNDGTEYVLLAYDNNVITFGKEKFIGKIKGDKTYFKHGVMRFRTGIFFSINDTEKRILRYVMPDSEWSAYYIKTDLQKIDLSVDNCIRLHLAEDMYSRKKTSNLKGIKGSEEIKQFLEEIRSQKSPEEAGLYESITQHDGFFENVYSTHVYGYFEEEPNLAIIINIKSFNDKAYSINLGEKEYVLPEKWYAKLIS